MAVYMQLKDREVEISVPCPTTEGGVLTVNVCVLNELGLHARPAARLAQEAQKFGASVTLVLGEQKVNAKSVLDILTLAASQGCGLVIIAKGDDARAAVDHLVNFFRNRCGEDK